MALSWIFSGRKKEEKPVPVTVEAVEVGSDEDYAIIQASSNPAGSSGGGLYPQVTPTPLPYSLLPQRQNQQAPLPYSPLPQRQDQQMTGSGVTRTNSVQNQLEGVPFILSAVLEQSSNTNHLKGLEDLRRAVFQIAADINDSAFDYDFKLERSVQQEASLYKDTS